MVKSVKKIIFISPLPIAAFISKDLEIIRKHFSVNLIIYKNRKDLWKLIIPILTSDLNISWFAWKYAKYAVFFSKIFKKKSVVIAGGFDSVNMPEINYGAMRDPKTASVARYAFEYADEVLAVSNSIKDGVLQYTKRKNVKTIYHGFDYNKFKPEGEKEDLVITIGYVSNSNLQRKGLEWFVRSAKHVQNIKFVLVGAYEDDTINYLKSIATSNVSFTGWVSQEELLEYMQKAKVYVQVSAHEGFGLSLAEAMLCECVPVVTDRGAIPEVVGDTGYYVPFGDPVATADAVNKSLKSDFGKKARDRIKIRYPLEKREKELVDVVESLIAN